MSFIDAKLTELVYLICPHQKKVHFKWLKPAQYCCVVSILILKMMVLMLSDVTFLSVTPLNWVACTAKPLSCHFQHNRSCSVRSLWWRRFIRLFTQQIMIEGYPTSCQLKRCGLIYRVDNAAFWSLERSGVSRSLGTASTRFYDDLVL